MRNHLSRVKIVVKGAGCALSNHLKSPGHDGGPVFRFPRMGLLDKRNVRAHEALVEWQNHYKALTMIVCRVPKTALL